MKKRRAQNRAAQRAYRERTKRHAKDLEAKIADMTTKYQSLQRSHVDLILAYRRLVKAFEFLTNQNGPGAFHNGRGVSVIPPKGYASVICGNEE
jgi:hypothetical protein